MWEFTSGWHSLALGTLLGTTFYTTFVAGPIQFKTLPRQVFGNLQRCIMVTHASSKQFPVYFLLQTTLSGVLLWTSMRMSRLDWQNLNREHWHVWVFALSLVSAALNWWVVGSWSTRIMFDRHKLLKKDSPVPPSLNRQFSILHGVSSLLNLVTLCACVINCFWLGSLIGI